MFTFLWGNIDGRPRYHLARWDSVVVPYEYGGWDIKNLERFGISLGLKCFWQLLMGSSIWNSIITCKYLKNCPLVDWIKARNLSITGTSYFWNGFLRIMSWITC